VEVFLWFLLFLFTFETSLKYKKNNNVNSAPDRTAGRVKNMESQKRHNQDLNAAFNKAL